MTTPSKTRIADDLMMVGLVMAMGGEKDAATVLLCLSAGLMDEPHILRKLAGACAEIGGERLEELRGRAGGGDTCLA